MEIAAGDPKAARNVLQLGVQKSPRDWDLRLLLAGLLIDLEEPALAEKQVAEMRKLSPKSPLPDYFQARFYMDKRQWPEAIALLERTRERVGGSPWSAQVNQQLGWCYLQVGDAEQQLLAYGRAAKERPDLVVPLAGMGSALLALGRLDEAMDYLQQAAKTPSPQRRTWVDRALRKNSAPNQAVPTGVWTDLARCLMLRNLRRPESERNWSEVNQAFEQAGHRQPSSVAIVILRVEIEMAQKKFDSARKLLEAARTEFPKSAPLECALADLLLLQNDFAEAQAVLERAEKALGHSADILQAQLRLWGRQASAKNREQVTRLGENLETFSPAERARLLRDLAETWVRLSDPRTAEQFWRRLIDEQPSDLRARLSLLDLSLQQGKIDAARQIVEDLRKVEGEKGACWHFGAAALLVGESLGPGPKLDQARKHLAESYRARPKWSRLPLLEAQIDETEGRFVEAIHHYLEAFGLGERTPRLMVRVIKLLQERREFITANKNFRLFEEQGPLQPDLAKLGAELALASNEGKRAVALGRLAVPADSRDYRDYLWLARLYQADGNFEQANELLAVAVAYAPYSPDVWIANVQHLALSGRLEAVPRLLSEMQKKVSPQRSAFTLARCYEVLGRFDEAEEQFRIALAQRPNDFALWAALADFYRQSDQPAKAIPLLEKLLDRSSAAPFALQAPARQQLALLLAGTGQTDGVARALELLGKGFYPDDECTRYLVLGFDPAKRDAAVRSFEEIRKRFPISAEELFYFAKVHLAADELQRARELLLDLVTSNPDNPQYLAQYTRALLQGDANGAAICFQKLKAREPDSPRTRELQALVRPGR
jgi:tetratricopeptide (TPR) repeat protein